MRRQWGLRRGDGTSRRISRTGRAGGCAQRRAIAAQATSSTVSARHQQTMVSRRAGHDLSQEAVFDDLGVMAEPSKGMAGHNALGRLDSSEEYELACGQSWREPGGHICPHGSLPAWYAGERPAPRGCLQPQKDCADQNRRCLPLVPGSSARSAAR